MDHITTTKKDIIWNYIGIFMAMGSNFIILPFLLNFLDSDTLGLWYVFLSIGALVNLFDFGFTPTFARNVAYSWSGAKKLNRTDADFIEKTEPNIGLLKIVIKTCEVVYFIISLTALILLLTLGTYYIHAITYNVLDNNYFTAWLIYCFAVFLNLLFGYYLVLLRGVGAIAEMNKATVLSKIVQIVLSIFLLYLGLGILAVSVAYLMSGVIFRLLAAKSFKHYHNMESLLKKEEGKISTQDVVKTLKIIWPNTWRDGLVSLSNYISNQSTVIMSSLFLSLSETGIYSISLQIVTAIATISGSLYATYQPELQAAYINKERDKSRRLMATAMTVYIGTFIMGIIALTTVGIPILSILKKDVVFNIPVLMGMSVYMFLLKNHSYYASYISNTNNVPYLKSFVLSSVFGIILTILLIHIMRLGVWALIIGPGFAQLIYNNWIWPHKVKESFSVTWSEFFLIGFKGTKALFIKERKRVNN